MYLSKNYNYTEQHNIIRLLRILNYDNYTDLLFLSYPHSIINSKNLTIHTVFTKIKIIIEK
jgi:hypothetical protein